MRRCCVGIGSPYHNAGVRNGLPYPGKVSRDGVCSLPATHVVYMGAHGEHRSIQCPYHKLIGELIRDTDMPAPGAFGSTRMKIYTIVSLEAFKGKEQ